MGHADVFARPNKKFLENQLFGGSINQSMFVNFEVLQYQYALQGL